MIALFIRHWKILLDCLIVVAAILVFTFWDPFSIFNTRKIRQTATLVTGVREIGELVTAEYYGEVIASLKDAKIDLPPVDETQLLAEEMYLALKRRYWTIRRRQVDGTAAFDIAPAERKDVYSKFVAFLGLQYLDRGLDKIYGEEKKIKNKLEERILKRLYDDVQNVKERLADRYKNAGQLEDKQEHYLDSIPPFINEFSDFYAMLTVKDVMEEEKKRDLVFIGRGWVKAGFRFNTFDESNFAYDSDAKVVHFYGLEPIILDKDINPWFIPERKVKGFEIVRYTGKVDFRHAKEVKKKCKEKLLKQAGKEILIRAQENGAEALRSFFSLLLDEPELKVEFHEMPYAKEYQTFASDTLITIQEALAIEKLYVMERERIEKDIVSSTMKQRDLRQLGLFIQKLKKLSFISENYPFSFYSIKAAHILADSLHVDTVDIATLIQARGKLVPDKDSLSLVTTAVLGDSLWFVDADFINEYHQALNVVFNKAFAIPGLRTLAIGEALKKCGTWMCLSDEKTRVLLWKSLHVDNISKQQYLLEAEVKAKPWWPYDLRYDVTTIIPDTTQLKHIQMHGDTAIHNKDMRTLRAMERQIVIATMARKNKRTKQLAPIEAFSKGVKKIISQFETK